MMQGMIHPAQRTASLKIEDVCDWVIQKGSNFPGMHNTPTERTNSTQKPLEQKAQMLIVWKALTTYLDENLRKGKSVNIRNFGAFTFDISTELPKISRREINPETDIFSQRAERKHIHTLRPCFVVDKALQTHLIRYKGKEEIVPANSQKSIFQQGFRMIYANPVPIAACCQMGKDVVEDTLKTIFMAIQDLVKLDYHIILAFGFANVSFVNKGLKCHFADYLTKQVKDKEFETTMRRSNSPVSTTWRTNTQQEFFKSSMGTMIRKPNAEVNNALNQKTQALRMMSLDMASASRFKSAAPK